MTKAKRYVIYCFVAVTGLIMLGMTFDVFAGGNSNNNHTYIDCYQCVTNHVNEVTEVNEVENWRLTGDLSDSDMIEVIGGALAGGSHQFDWVTTRWQLSITGATTTSDWDEDTNFSFAIGKRFGKEHWMPNALYHLSYTPDLLGNDYVVGGATIPIGGQ